MNTAKGKTWCRHMDWKFAYNQNVGWWELWDGGSHLRVMKTWLICPICQTLRPGYVWKRGKIVKEKTK